MMMTMKSIYKLLLMSLVVAATACYNDFDAPEMDKPLTAADMEAMGLDYISIKDVKARFWSETGAGAGSVAAWKVDEPLYTRGKVISSDRYGSIYKTMYIFDEESQSAIELKVTSGNYLYYPAGREIFVALQGLTLGNYRGMVSIGAASVNPKYSNDNIESLTQVNKHVFRGEQIGLTAADTLVVTRNNYAQLTEDALGCLVRFEGVQSVFGQAQWGYKNNFPNYFANSNSYDATAKGGVDGVAWSELTASGQATWALAGKMNDDLLDTYFYGSAWFAYEDAKGSAGSDSNAAPGNYVVRTSGYAQFRDAVIPTNGTEVDLTAIYTKYTNTSGRYVTYQLVLCNDADVVVK